MIISCPKLTELWSCFFKMLDEALNITLEPCLLIAILGTPLIPNLTKKDADVVSFASLFLPQWNVTVEEANPPSAIFWLNYLMTFLS